MLLPAIYATLNGLSSRNYVGLAVLSTVAMGVAAATLGHWLTSRTTGRRISPRFVWAAISIVLISGAIAGQRAAGRPSESSLPGQIHDWLRPRIHAGSQVVMSFRYSDITALSLFELATVPELPITRYQPAQGLGPYLWLGLRDQQLFGFRRTAWVAMLGDARTSHLVLAGPHVFTPAELFPALEAGLLDGVTIAKRLVDGRESARIYTVDPGLAITEPTLALHLAPAAALVWLETARSSQAGVSVEQMLVDAGPVLVGDDARLVLERLAGSACLVPSGEGRGARKNDTPDSFRLVPATVDAASQPGSICTAEA
jgi:hypothetical protein